MRIPADRWIAYYKLELKITAQDQLNLSTGQTCAKKHSNHINGSFTRSLNGENYIGIEQ
jgi:hypothetical protein